MRGDSLVASLVGGAFPLFVMVRFTIPIARLIVLLQYCGLIGITSVIVCVSCVDYRDKERGLAFASSVRDLANLDVTTALRKVSGIRLIALTVKRDFPPPR